MKIIFRDVNAAVVEALLAIDPALDASVDSIFSGGADAVVSPGNSFGFMDGGIDAVYTKRFGSRLQEDLQAYIVARPMGELLVGEAVVVVTGEHEIFHVVCAPTMRVPRRILDPVDVMLACKAAYLAAAERGVQKLAFPGMGTGCGALQPATAAKAMINGIVAAKIRGLPPLSWREAQSRHFESLQ